MTKFKNSRLELRVISSTECGSNRQNHCICGLLGQYISPKLYTHWQSKNQLNWLRVRSSLMSKMIPKTKQEVKREKK